MVTPACSATSSIDTVWKPEVPNARRATSRSWARRSGARIRRRAGVGAPFVCSTSATLATPSPASGWRAILPTGNLPISNLAAEPRPPAPEATSRRGRRGLPAHRGPAHHPEVDPRVRRAGDPSGRRRVRPDRGVPLAGGEEGGRGRAVLDRVLHGERGRGPDRPDAPHRPGGDVLGVCRHLARDLGGGPAPVHARLLGHPGAARHVGAPDLRHGGAARSRRAVRHRVRRRFGRLGPSDHGPP